MTELEDERRFFEGESDEEHAGRLDDENEDKKFSNKSNGGKSK